MPKATVTFEKCVQDAKEYGSDEYMVSRVFFTLDVGRKYTGLAVDVKQTVGSSYEEGTIEVGSPNGDYRGPWNHQAFREAVTLYYLGLVGVRGSAGRIGAGARNIRMYNNTVVKRKVVEFDVAGADVSW